MKKVEIDWKVISHVSAAKYYRTEKTDIDGIIVYREIVTGRDRAGFPTDNVKVNYYINTLDSKKLTEDEFSAHFDYLK